MTSRRAQAQVQVRWANGVRIDSADIACDAESTHGVCFVSAADRVTRMPNSQLIATSATLSLLAGRGKTEPTSVLSVPYAQPFTLGTKRLELIRSGYCVGSASLLIDTGTSRVLYAGRISLAGGVLAGSADVRGCDVAIVDAHYGHPDFDFPRIHDVVQRLTEYAATKTQQQQSVVVLVSTVGKGLEVAFHLHSAGLVVTAHRTIHSAAQDLRTVLPPVALRRWSGKPRGGEVVVWPRRHRDKLLNKPFASTFTVVLVSGDAVSPRRVADTAADVAFPWSSQAGYQCTLEYIEHTGARYVYATGRHSLALVDALRKRGVYAQPLGAPEQLDLFP